MRHGKKIRRPPGERQPLSVAPNAVWNMDSVSDALANGRRLKSLTIADDFTHECIDIAVDHGISGACIVRVLKRAARFRGYPRAVRTDNGAQVHQPGVHLLEAAARQHAPAD